MKIFYSAKPVNHNDFDRDVRFANPDFFEKVNSQAKEVAINGNYPEIEKAYKAIGVKVEVIGKPKAKKPKAK